MGKKTDKIIRFFDGESLEDLICTYALKLPKKYSPIQYISDCDIKKETLSFVNIYFFQDVVSSVYNTSELFQNYELTEKNILQRNFCSDILPNECFSRRTG